ncbi:serine hydrolase [Paenibacillus sp. 453mf]|uniref:serine hydrolase domain-containing protein n=1 Tax=Paenibacillus sp. 453mf TaxID=1761874 RepID=UPI0008E282E6|nr:serine hydrolase [Paenibacillus sp. 453mf]SFS82521.1 CubicO group peptidase, beta-lactamase class C family [Paenibacillus sp. 453mf]
MNGTKDAPDPDNTLGIPDIHECTANEISLLIAKIDELKLEVNSLVLMKDGRLEAEFYREPYRKECSQLLYSLSKSFTSIATGIAWDQGFIRLNDPVISFFPDKLPSDISPNLAKMTIHHLLSMNTGHHDNIYAEIAREQDWVRAFLSLEVKSEPGTYHLYNTHATYMLSAILERVTGHNLVDFLMPTLFDPLNIPRPIWETCPMGITAGGMGLSLTTDSVAKFGQMLLDKGMYAGKRIVSERYIELATTKHSDTTDRKDRIDWQQGYGYQFHMCRQGCYRGDGSFGQLCFVAPSAGIVVAAHSSFKSMQPLQTLLDFIYSYVLSPPLKLSSDKLILMEKKLHLSSRLPELMKIPIGIQDIGGRCYRLENHPEGLRMLHFHAAGDRLDLQMNYGDERDQVLTFDLSKPVSQQGLFYKDLSLHVQEVVACASWVSSHTLQLTLFYIETPYMVTYRLEFKEREIELSYHMNVSFSLRHYQVKGHLQSPQIF